VLAVILWAGAATSSPLHGFVVMAETPSLDRGPLWHSSQPMSTTRILYNDRCPICRAEIAHYRARATATGAPLVFEDLNTADLGGWRLTPDQAKRRLHAALPDGRIISGIPAFAAIWAALPGLGWLARLVMLPGLRHLADLAYNRMAAPWLYRRQVRREAQGLARNATRP